MSRVVPFRALRPAPALAARVASVPYDVVNADEARALAAGNDLSFLRVVRSEIGLPPGTDPYGDEVYRAAARSLQDLAARGALVREDTPVFYVYRIVAGAHSQTGIACGVAAEEYEDNGIRRHELTRREKEDDRLRHINACRAYTEPVLLMYRAVAAIDAAVGEVTRGAPLFDFTAPDDLRHTLWRVDDPGVQAAVRSLFADVPALYIADGHHRAAAAARHARRSCREGQLTEKEKDCEYFPAVVFPHDQLRVLGYHRVIRDLDGRSPGDVLAAAGKAFIVEATIAPPRVEPGVIGMLLGGGWYLLRPRPGVVPLSDPVASLDVAVLQDHLLGLGLGIGDPRTSPRIDFVGGSRGHEELERRCGVDSKAAFLLAPVRVAQIMSVSDAGKIMPPKSTWFDPKLRSGLFIKTIDD